MKKQKVVLGMSGGMDSSAAAVLLVEQGYGVEGVTLKVWADDDQPERRWQERSCCKVGLARYVAGRLGIPHRVIDVREAFREGVVRDFIDGYLSGNTPNPCVRCNERIKFGMLFQTAMDMGADWLATGHYARVGRDAGGRHCLLQGVDRDKDQSYFLHRLRPEILPRLMFPLGSYRKSEIGHLIESLDLPPEELRESQEICFVTQGDYREFLATEAPESARPGRFVTAGGRVLGEHRGVAFYTVGQRRGLGLSSPESGERLYVLGVDPSTDRVTVGPEKALYAEGLTVGQMNYLRPASRWREGEIGVRIRYRSRAVPVTVTAEGDGRLRAAFDDPQRAVSPGQSAVFYEGETVLGGGIIETVTPGGTAS
jgi:tRNA-specific 2-thiouridylase